MDLSLTEHRVEIRRRALLLVYVIAASSAVYLFAHQDALTNQYVVMDDVRQQLFWMQRWSDPELFRDDLLSAYARNYVPWGVQAIYAAGARVMNPVQFSKVVAGVLYVVTAVFLFGLGLRFRDELTAVFVVAAYCFSPFFLTKISGGLSQGFGFPLLAGYLYFLSKDQVCAAGVVILAASLLNPYIFLLCLVTHALYVGFSLIHPTTIPDARATREESGDGERNFPRTGTGTETAASIPQRTEGEGAGMRALDARGQLGRGNSRCRWNIAEVCRGRTGGPWTLADAVRHAARHVPVALGVLLVAGKYLLFNPKEFGDLVTQADMAGLVEYTAAGRYEIIPGAPMLMEFIRPGIVNLSFNEWGLAAGFVCLTLLAAGAVCAFREWRRFIDPWGFRVFFFLCPASFMLYGAACVALFRLFLPERYAEFPLNVFYVVVVGIAMRVGFGMLVSDRVAFPVVTSLIIIMGALKLYHVGITDCSDQARLYQFLRTTPKESLFAGNPRLMDNVVTFGARKAFVTYELSHPWYKGYWATIKRRTSDLFDAYYSDSPEKIHHFCRENGIDYLVVRERDFSSESLKSGQIHFEPFDARIRNATAGRSSFALLDAKAFPPIFREDGVRVVKCTTPPSESR